VVQHIFRHLPQPDAVLTYDDCFFNPQREIVKPLDKLYEKYPQLRPETTVIVDDRHVNFTYNPHNGILIPAYSPAPDEHHLGAPDEALLHLMTWLEQQESGDVRSADKSRIFTVSNSPGRGVLSAR
jgi:hypothetical protein